MKKNKTEILIALDRSGSISNIAKDLEGGLETYLNTQKKEPGECFVTLYTFDDRIDKSIIYANIQHIGKISITPRGSTALFDCLGDLITDAGNRLAKTPEKERPELVIALVLTDGMNNASKRYTKDQIAKMIKHQEEKYNWQFVFMGANFDAFSVGGGYGFDNKKIMHYTATAKGVHDGLATLNTATTYMRSAVDKTALKGYDINQSAK